ncbi:MAG: Rho termination factor N-terminal domain-containing protein, partial [Nocardioides sp.]
MTETVESTSAKSADSGAPAPKKKSGGLNSMLLADLKSMAGGLGIRGAGSMKKAQLVDAIKAAQSGGQAGGRSGGPADRGRSEEAHQGARESKQEPKQERA